ncbi:MAG TPA: HAMP domain-containing sensor histidine kinase [Actinomycetota bacterium]
MTEERAAATTREADAPEPRSRRILWGVRARMLTWYIVVLTVAIGASVLVARQVLIAQLDERIDRDLVQESEELRRLSGGRDPSTGEPFRTNVRRIFEVFLQRNIPARNETFLTIVGGEPFERSFREPPYRLDRDPELVERWSGLQRADRGRVETPAGDVEYLAVPVRSGGRTRGVFVAAIFRDLELEDIQQAIWGTVGVGLVTLVIGSILAWRVIGGVLGRVKRVTDTARDFSDDLTRRLHVTGNDEVSHLALTFNGMLDRLEDLMETQRRFVDDAGHELRTPITVIRGHLELLDDDPEERERTLALVTDELDRMQRIVNDLLILAKAERPDFLDLEPVPLDRLTEEIHAKAKALGERDWRLQESAAGIVIGDRQRLTQAVMQLAQNAVQNTQTGSEIGIGSSMQNGEARLWVRDTGPGIPPDQRDRLFARFSRGVGRRRSEGAGLGLAIVRAIAEAHHGRVEVESPPGSGATVSVVIPVDQPEEGRDA